MRNRMLLSIVPLALLLFGSSAAFAQVPERLLSKSGQGRLESRIKSLLKGKALVSKVTVNQNDIALTRWGGYSTPFKAKYGGVVSFNGRIKSFQITTGKNGQEYIKAAKQVRDDVGKVYPNVTLDPIRALPRQTAQ